MYQLILTKGERDAFDWVGNRYAAGDVAKLLLDCMPEDAEWDSEGEILFSVPEHVAWEINTLAEEEEHQWPCFAPDLASKMNVFCQAIV
jgi:hypothetical protein